MDRFLFDLNPNPILIYETESLHILDANDAFFKKYGYSKEEINEVSIKDIRPKDKMDEFHDSFDQYDEEVNETKLVHHQSKEGKVFFVDISAHDYPSADVDARIVLIHDVTDRVLAERKAQQAFFELNHHMNESPLAMIKWDAQFNIIEWSQRSQEILGYGKEEMLGKTPRFFSFHKARDRAIVENNIRKILLGTQDRTEFDVRIYNKKEELVDLRIHGSALRDEEGNLVSILTLLEDISEQKKAEIRYHRLFENANDGIFLMKGEKFVECNNEVAKIYGCEKHEILGATPIDFSPEFQPDGQKSSDKALKKIKKALNGAPQVFEWKHLKKDGTPIDVEVSLNRLDLTDEVYVQAIVRDLTDKKKAEKKQRKSEQLFRKLFLKAPGALIMVDRENRVQMVNQSFEELFGYTEEELMGKDIDKAIVSEDDYHMTPRMPGDEFRNGKFYEDVIRYTKDGEPRDILLGAIPVFLDEEPIAGFGIYIDITDQKENERKLKQSLEEKQVLLEEIHHRVKNNLAIISGLLQLQAFETEDEKTKNALNDGQLRIQSIGLVHELLYQSESFIDISFETYINKLIDTIKKTLPFDHQHIEIKVETGGVSMDINQAIPCAILINELVTNAYKHGFNDSESGAICVNLKETADQIILTVSDNGVGLPDDFSIVNKSSIGLSLIQTLTDQLEGTLKYSSDNGARFEVHFDKNKKKGSGSLYMLPEEE